MEQWPQPYCRDCLVPLIIKHVMVECLSHQKERRRLLGIQHALQNTDSYLKRILANSRDFNIENIMEYLKPVQFFSKM